jgi:hypothetical protein
MKNEEKISLKITHGVRWYHWPLITIACLFLIIFGIVFCFFILPFLFLKPIFDSLEHFDESP